MFISCDYVPHIMRLFTQCGYLIDKDHLKTFFMKKEEREDGEEYNSFSLPQDLRELWYNLPKEIRAKMPIVYSSCSCAMPTTRKLVIINAFCMF
jgi:hypothetical protein